MKTWFVVKYVLITLLEIPLYLLMFALYVAKYAFLFSGGVLKVALIGLSGGRVNWR